MLAIVYSPVLVIVLDEPVIDELDRATTRYGWPVLTCTSALDAIRATYRHRPRVVIVQVPACLDETLELIRTLRQGALRVLLVGCVRRHDEAVERALRIAGVDCYLPDPSRLECLEEVVSTALAGESSLCVECQEGVNS